MADERHVWAIRTADYQREAAAYRSDSPEYSSERGLTIFRADGASPEDAVIEIFGTVDEHHGEHSHDPPFDEVEILGASATPAVRDELSAFGFAEILPSDRGFVALRR